MGKPLLQPTITVYYNDGTKIIAEGTVAANGTVTLKSGIYVQGAAGLRISEAVKVRTLLKSIFHSRETKKHLSPY